MGDAEEANTPDDTIKRCVNQGSAKAAADNKPVTPKAAVAASVATDKQASSTAPGSSAAADKAAGSKPAASTKGIAAAVDKALVSVPAAPAATASAKTNSSNTSHKSSDAAAASSSSDGAATTLAAGEPPAPAAAGSTAVAVAAEDAAQTPAAGQSTAAAAGVGSSAAAAAAGGGDGDGSHLDDPSCRPGALEFETAAKKVRETLAVYKARTKQHLQSNRAKPDMIAYSELRSEYTPAERYGHIPGVRVGQEFLGRGELAILGLHTSMMRGIMSKKGKPAYAIAMSGGYKDDTDTGHTFWYTGQGGQKAGKQVEDQSYSSPDNAALVASCNSNAPVRVFRGKVGANGERLYVYEGLYRVAAYKKEESQDGPLVCKFEMVGIPGHSVVSSTVEYRCLLKSHLQSQLLARGPAARAGNKRGRAGEVKLKSRSEVADQVQQRKAAGNHGRLVTPDLSEGQEKLPIPVWNAADDEDSILLHLGQQPEQPDQPDPNSLDGEPAVFVYTSDYKFGEEEAKQLAIAAEKEFSRHFPCACGIQYAGKEHDKEGNYNEDGLMLSTQPSGVMECDAGCKHSKLCRLNRVVSEGIRYPIEVFKVSREVGWGVRCSEGLPVGAFICCYIGLVITDEWAETLREQDLYLFDLSHFHLLWKVDKSDDTLGMNFNPNLHKLEGELQSKHLVIDANRQGNVARFINHSCEPNCVVQTVFAGNARSQLLYYMAIVALKDIPAYAELTYDYCYGSKPEASEEVAAGASASQRTSSQQDVKSVRIPCQCGASTCRRILL